MVNLTNDQEKADLTSLTNKKHIIMLLHDKLRYSK